MRHDCLRTAGVNVRRPASWHHREGVTRGGGQSGGVGNTRFWSALIDMLIDAGRVLSHAGHCHERRDEDQREDVFHRGASSVFLVKKEITEGAVSAMMKIKLMGQQC
jgi:hypothetical protein